MRSAKSGAIFLAVALALVLIAIPACKKKVEPTKPDIAGMQRGAEDPKMKELLVDPFPGMNGTPAGALSADEIRGRVVWNLWTGDSYLMWDYLARHGFGTSDLLKVIDSRNRANRFKQFGTINQPGFMTAIKPDEFGLFLDVPRPGDPEGDIDTRLPIDEYTYGRSSGVMGLRVYKNPAFDAKAAAEWKKHIGPDGINHDFY
ncbi:MAG TPA: hypothetical protein VF787_06975, partial [Thermoanaerobaculia bacterium]